jgi:hypothetical protein
MEWEEVLRMGTDVLQRLPLPGGSGWLYRNVIMNEKRPDVWETTVALCFVPRMSAAVTTLGAAEPSLR